jgi:hypothetical protein
MRTVVLDETWAEFWRDAFNYDCEEVFGRENDRGYAYVYQNQ